MRQGGDWTEENKKIPGVYIHYETRPQSLNSVGARGICAIAKSLNWGKNNEIITIEDLTSLEELIGYDINSSQALFIREMFKGTDLTDGASKILLYRLRGIGEAKATGSIGNLNINALYSGTRGNDISIIVAPDTNTEALIKLPEPTPLTITKGLTGDGTQELQITGEFDTLSSIVSEQSAFTYNKESKTIQAIGTGSGYIDFEANKEGNYGATKCKVDVTSSERPQVDASITETIVKLSLKDTEEGSESSKISQVLNITNTDDADILVENSNDSIAEYTELNKTVKGLEVGDCTLTFTFSKEGKVNKVLKVNVYVVAVDADLDTVPTTEPEQPEKEIKYDINIVIGDNQSDAPGGEKRAYCVWNIQTVVSNSIKDTQTVGQFEDEDNFIEGKIEDLQPNKWVEFNGEGEFTANVGTYLSGGNDGELDKTSYSDFMSALEEVFFNTLIYDGDDMVIKSSLASLVKSLSFDYGSYCNLVVANYTTPNNECVISVKNGVQLETGEVLTAEQCTWWVGGATAGANYNESLTYHQYPGAVSTDKFKRSELEKAADNGEFVIFDNEGRVCALYDINTFTSFTTTKGKVLRKNRPIRTIFQICNDLYSVYSKYYVGKVDADSDGLDLMKAEAIGYLNKIQAGKGIKNFAPEDITVSNGQDSDAVIIEMYLTVVDSAEKIYIKMVIGS